MKKFCALAVGTALLLRVGMPLAQEAMAPASTAGAATAPSGMPMMAGPMGQMDEHMKTMQALHERMMNAPTSEERQKVMADQRREMQAGMGMMNQMMHGGRMMGGMSGGMTGQKGKAAGMTQQMQMMQMRIDMMQMMMQAMMDQQGLMAAPKGPDAAPKK